MRGTMVLGLLGSIGLVLAGCQKKADEPQPEPSPKAAARETPPAPTPPPAPAPKSGTELAEAYKKCMAAWDAKDENTVASCWAENASAEVVDFGQPAVTGRKEIIDKLNRPNWTAFPDGKDEPILIAVSGHQLAAFDRITGTNKGELHGMAATGKKVTFHVAHLIDVDDQGEFEHSRGYGDMGNVLAQLGHSPKPARAALDPGWNETKVVIAGDTPDERSNADAAARLREAFNAHDIAAMVAVCTDDVAEKDYGSQEAAKGKKAMEQGLKAFFTAFPDIKIAVDKQFAAGDWVIENGTLTGTNSGDMPAMKMKKTGKSVAIGYLEFMRFQGGKLAEVHRFYNGMAFAQQLGMIPEGKAGEGGSGKKAAKTK